MLEVMPDEPKMTNSLDTNTPSFDHPNKPVLPPKQSKKWWVIGFAIVLVLAVGTTWWFAKRGNGEQSNTTKINQHGVTVEEAALIGNFQLDPGKDYGDKYANGLLPVGDGRYTTDGPRKGYIYMCNANFVPANQAGAQTRGPWFTNNNTQWDINKKAAIQGKVNWEQNITSEIKDGKRIITTNDLPAHHTGVFPVASSDPAKMYDANPNAIKAQSFVYSLTANPENGNTPQCMGGEVGIMLSGVALFNGFDAGGRDAGAWEVQDSCDGHPQNHGAYHYHTLSRCISDISVQTVIGFALDGFPITGPKVGEKNILTTDDLDECHGIVSDIKIDGKTVTSYHYVMTQDFPYSASCFRAAAIKPPGQAENASSSAPQQPPQQGQPTQKPPPGYGPPPQ